MPYSPVNVVEIEVWGTTVGAAVLDPGSGYYAFEYDPSWVRGGIELAPLHLPLSSGPRVFPTLPEQTYRRLPALLADAVPDKFGNALIDAYMASNGVPLTSMTPLDRLAYIGRRGMGALVFKPPRGPQPDAATGYQIGDLVKEARSALSGSFGTETDAIADATEVLKDVAAAVASWNEHAALAGVPAATQAAIALDLAAFEI